MPPLFRLVCPPAALAGWPTDTLQDGEVALLVDDCGLPAINALSHELDVTSVTLVRAETTDELQEQTVIAHAGSLATVWISASFSDAARGWAQARGPMTLLVEAEGTLDEQDRRRIERFVALLGRQAE